MAVQVEVPPEPLELTAGKPHAWTVHLTNAGPAVRVVLDAAGRGGAWVRSAEAVALEPGERRSVTLVVSAPDSDDVRGGDVVPVALQVRDADGAVVGRASAVFVLAEHVRVVSRFGTLPASFVRGADLPVVLRNEGSRQAAAELSVTATCRARARPAHVVVPPGGVERATVRLVAPLAWTGNGRRHEISLLVDTAVTHDNGRQPLTASVTQRAVLSAVQVVATGAVLLAVVVAWLLVRTQG